MSLTEIMDAVRGTDKEAGLVEIDTLEEKKNYLLHLIEVMSSDDDYPSLEIHVIDFIAKKMGVTPMQILSFVMDDIEDGSIDRDEGFDIINNFVRYYAKIGK